MSGAPTEDVLLGGRVRLLQPRAGFRASTDAVLLAAACPARAGEAVLDLGCGVGAAAFCLAARVDGLSLAGLELNPETADLARRNAALNKTALEVHEGDVAAPPAALKTRTFDQVIANPPYFAASGRAAADPGRDMGRRGGDVAAWVDAGLRRLRQGGGLSMIHLVETLPTILGVLEGRAGDVAVLPLAPRAGRTPRRMILTALKDRRGPFRLAPPLVLHAGESHLEDGDDFTPAFAAVLRDAAPLVF